MGDAEYKMKKEANRWLTLSVEFEIKKEQILIPLVERNKWRLPAISRIDWFKHEQCIETHYDPFNVFPAQSAEVFASNKRRNPLDGLHPIFRDHNLTRHVIRTQSVWNLRVCTCK